MEVAEQRFFVFLFFFSNTSLLVFRRGRGAEEEERQGGKDGGREGGGGGGGEEAGVKFVQVCTSLRKRHFDSSPLRSQSAASLFLFLLLPPPFFFPPLPWALPQLYHPSPTSTTTIITAADPPAQHQKQQQQRHHHHPRHDVSAQAAQPQQSPAVSSGRRHTHPRQTPPPSPAPPETQARERESVALGDRTAAMENASVERRDQTKEVSREEEEEEEETMTPGAPTVSNGPTDGEKKLQNGDRGGGGGGGAGGGGDLSPINAMMSAVMSAAGTLNGQAEPQQQAGGGGGGSLSTSPTGPSPSPSPGKMPSGAMRAPPSRNPRRNQDTKDDSSAFICPLCDKNCETQHQLTMHIRQHNADAGATDHSCSICGKCLSSASSLDRHMLVHSGERPYKCNICGQTFTTNGNMHRHMKIHEKDPASGLLPVSPPSPTKRRRPSVKRRLEEENGEEPPIKKASDDAVSEEAAAALHGAEEELLPCPLCFKTCSSRLELDAHMDTHPDMALRCDLCCLSFRTHRGLLRHNAAVHKLLPLDPSGRPFIQNNPSIPTGFNDLAFIDFSCNKFPHIAQVWCETNLRRCISKFHRFVCDGCDKAFPLRSALDMHKAAAHPEKPGPTHSDEQGAEQSQAEAKSDLPVEQASFLQGLGLQHISTVKAGPSDDEIHQAHLDSIKVIQVEAGASSLPQEPTPTFLTLGLGSLGSLGGLGGLGGLAALSIPLLEPSGSAPTLQGLSQRDALSLLSLQPFQAGFLLQPDGGAATGSTASSGAKPREGSGSSSSGAAAAGVMELADIQQILKVAAAAPNQMGLTLPALAKTPGVTTGQGLVQGQRSMPPLKPKPPLTPRSSLTAGTPPPLQSSQQASLGCISPSLPPPTPSLFKTPPPSSSSSSSASAGGGQDAECMGDAQTPLSDSPPATHTALSHEESALSGARKAGSKSGSAAGGAKGSFQCRFCDQSFAFSGVLQAHMRFHLGVLPHQCNICDYVAPDKATLIRHLRTHSGERPYVCRVCHYPFTVKANCERHLRKKHGKTSRKDIEKNIKYVTSTTGSSGGGITSTGHQEVEVGGSATETACRFCGEDLKSYRGLQIHLRTHNGCQRKPYECRRCGAAFLAKRNCIHHLLKQHPEVQEREIEQHIATLLPATVTATASRATATVGKAQVKVEAPPPASLYTPDDQPLDFSARGRGRNSRPPSPGGVKEEGPPSPAALGLDSDQPIDLSVPSKRQRVEPPRPSQAHHPNIKIEQQQQQGAASEQPLPLSLSQEEKPPAASPLVPLPPQLGCYQLPPGSAPPTSSLAGLNAAARAPRLKPLLPKPAATPSPSPGPAPSPATKELPPLASIAQIIHSVSGAPDLLRREAAAPLEDKSTPTQAGDTATGAPTNIVDPLGSSGGPEAASDDSGGDGSARKRPRKKAVLMAKSSGVDLESSGEFASVEKMLATTDTNKFRPFLQGGATELVATKRDVGVVEEQEGGGAKEEGGRSKGKKNAYSNSAQKMTCPYCPRVFPWASSLQRHMLTHTGQKPFPCPKCDAFFSTKSNCERHLLRKHGVTARTLRRNGNIVKKDGDDGSPESAESQSETEQITPEKDPSHPQDTGSGQPEEPETGPDSPAPKPNQAGGATEQFEAGAPEQNDLQGEPEGKTFEEKQPLQSSSNKADSGADDDDCHSNKSLDLNFGKKLIDFKLSTSSGPAPEEEPVPSNSLKEEEEEEEAEASPDPARSSPAPKQPDFKHICDVCKKSFRYATTLARHQRAHLCEEAPPPAKEEEQPPSREEEEEKEEEVVVVNGEKREEEMLTEAEPEDKDEEEEGGNNLVIEGGANGEEAEEEEEGVDEEGEDDEEEEEDHEEEEDEEEREKEGRSDEEASEPKSMEGGSGGEASGRRLDKRKKICNICGKRFWSLQDLTRHLRSHTGERPYRCQTCARTFTLKHSLVRHQRIHLKPRSGGGSTGGGPEDGASEDGDEVTPTSTCPPSENESECGSGVAAKELEEEREEEVGEEQEEAEGEGAVSKTEGAEPQAPADSSLDQPATDTKTTGSGDDHHDDSAPKDSTPKDPSTSDPAPAEGFLQGLLEIHTKPPLPPLVGVE